MFTAKMMDSVKKGRGHQGRTDGDRAPENDGGGKGKTAESLSPGL